MADYLFPNALRDSAEYEHAERFWQEQWRDLITRLGEGPFWETPWIGTTFADGTPCRDGNPIFSAVSRSRGIGIRVIQVEPGDDPRELAFWIDQFDGGDEGTTRELVIACILSPQNVTYAKDLMSQWITAGEVEIQPPRVGVPLRNEWTDVGLGPLVAP